MPTVVLQPGPVLVEARRDETVLDAIRRSGYSVPYSCRRGGCGVCKAELLDGQVAYPRRVAESVLADVDKARGVCLTCRAVPVTNVVIEIRGGQPRLVLPFLS